MRTLFLVSVALLVLFGVCGCGGGGDGKQNQGKGDSQIALGQEKANDDLDKLQGFWVLESIESEGKMMPKARTTPNTLLIKADKLIRRYHVAASDSWKTLPEATFKIDPTKKPKWIDQVYKGKSAPVLGLYELERDTLKLYFYKEERPKELKTTPDSNENQIIMIYRREKK